MDLVGWLSIYDEEKIIKENIKNRSQLNINGKRVQLAKRLKINRTANERELLSKTIG